MEPTEKKPVCPACSRNIVAPEHRKCMYCGLTLPKEHVLSDKEAIALKREKHAKWQEEHERGNMWGQREKKKDDDDDDDSWL